MNQPGISLRLQHGQENKPNRRHLVLFMSCNDDFYRQNVKEAGVIGDLSHFTIVLTPSAIIPI